MLPTSRSSYKWSPWTNIERWSEPWAILCRHSPVPEVGEHSANPCLVETITYSLEIGKDQFSARISRNAARDRNWHCVRLASDEGPAGSLNRFAPGEA